MNKIRIGYVKWSPVEQRVLIMPMEVNNELETFQTLVGGYIEHVALNDHIDLICDEEAKLKDRKPLAVLEWNGLITDTINGDFIICSHDGSELTSIDYDLIVEHFSSFFDYEDRLLLRLHLG